MVSSPVDQVQAGAAAVHGLRDRLAFTLPDFTRLSWVSDTARAAWEPRLQRITAAWLEIEWQAVVQGVRRCAVTIVGPEAFVERGALWAGHGLNALPIEIMGTPSQSYSATPVPYVPGQPFSYRFVLGRPADVVQFRQAWQAGDQEAIGSLLGYPPCCREFFRHTWVDLGMVDTTWPMAAATAVRAPADEPSVTASGPPEANILWRWMGVRAVPHLPCRMDCEASAEFGRRLIAVGRSLGYDSEMDDLEQVLSWPVEWSALHGVAEIKTPILKVSTRTDATGRKHIVRREGDAYPVEGARGLDFPYRPSSSIPLTQSKAFQRGLSNSIALPVLDPTWKDAEGNGFSTKAAMDAAHEPIVMLASRVLQGKQGDVLDLGCGNGALLDKILRACPTVNPVGVELDAARVAQARLLHSRVAPNILVGDLYELGAVWDRERQYDLALIMPGRLLEAAPDRAAWLKERLRTQCDVVLVYAYGDWLTRHGDIAGLAQAAGLGVQGAAPGASVGLVQW